MTIHYDKRTDVLNSVIPVRTKLSEIEALLGGKFPMSYNSEEVVIEDFDLSSLNSGQQTALKALLKGL